MFLHAFYNHSLAQNRELYFVNIKAKKQGIQVQPRGESKVTHFQELLYI